MTQLLLNALEDEQTRHLADGDLRAALSELLTRVEDELADARSGLAE